MEVKRLKSIVFTGILILFLVSYYDFNISLLLFFLTFQTVSFFGIINNVKTYKKTRTGIYVKGRVKEVRKIKSEENSSDSYESLIEFSYPTGENKYSLLHRSVSINPPEEDYNIWINERKIEDSVVVNSFNTYWLYTLIFYVIVISGLFIADFFLIKKIFMSTS